jgi:hypothetical protein
VSLKCSCVKPVKTRIATLYVSIYARSASSGIRVNDRAPPPRWPRIQSNSSWVTRPSAMLAFLSGRAQDPSRCAAAACTQPPKAIAVQRRFDITLKGPRGGLAMRIQTPIEKRDGSDVDARGDALANEHSPGGHVGSLRSRQVGGARASSARRGERAQRVYRLPSPMRPPQGQHDASSLQGRYRAATGCYRPAGPSSARVL